MFSEDSQPNLANYVLVKIINIKVSGHDSLEQTFCCITNVSKKAASSVQRFCRVSLVQLVQLFFVLSILLKYEYSFFETQHLSREFLTRYFK